MRSDLTVETSDDRNGSSGRRRARAMARVAAGVAALEVGVLVDRGGVWHPEPCAGEDAAGPTTRTAVTASEAYGGEHPLCGAAEAVADAWVALAGADDSQRWRTLLIAPAGNTLPERALDAAVRTRGGAGRVSKGVHAVAVALPTGIVELVAGVAPAWLADVGAFGPGLRSFAVGLVEGFASRQRMELTAAASAAFAPPAGALLGQSREFCRWLAAAEPFADGWSAERGALVGRLVGATCDGASATGGLGEQARAALVAAAEDAAAVVPDETAGQADAKLCTALGALDTPADLLWLSCTR